MAILRMLFGPPSIEKLKAKRDVPALARMLQQTDSASRAAAAGALGDLGEPAAVATLIPFLRDLDVGVSKAVAEALRHLGWQPENEDDRVAFLVAAGDLDGLLSLGSLAVRPLVELLKHHAAASRDTRVGGLLKIDVHAGNATSSLVVDRPATVDARSAVMNALRMFGAQAVAPLLDAIKEEDKAVSQHASWALAEIGEPALRPLVFAYLAECSGWDKDASPLDARVVGPICAIARDCRAKGRPGVVSCFDEYQGEAAPAVLRGLAVLAWEPAEFDAWMAARGSKRALAHAPSSELRPAAAGEEKGPLEGQEFVERPGGFADTYQCSECGKVLEEIGVPSQIQFAQMHKQTYDIGSSQVPEEVKADPFLFRGFYCADCNRVFCPSCSNMQGEICPECGKRQLMPAYRPLLKNLKTRLLAVFKL